MNNNTFLFVSVTALILFTAFVIAVIVRVSIRGYFREKHAHLKTILLEEDQPKQGEDDNG